MTFCALSLDRLLEAFLFSFRLSRKRSVFIRLCLCAAVKSGVVVAENECKRGGGNDGDGCMDVFDCFEL